MKHFTFFVALPILMLVAAETGQSRTFENAGVLPYSTSSGEVRVLLGFDGEREVWSDFVGVCAPGESAAQTAAREFVEETRDAYPFADVLGDLQAIEPIVIGPTQIFLLEVEGISAAHLESLTKSRDSEKIEYCWVPVEPLLQSIDDDGPDRAEVPESCGAGSQDLFNLVGNNLSSGRELRNKLRSPNTVRPLGLALRARCGR